MSNSCILQNFRLVLLDKNIDETNNYDTINIIGQLRQTVNQLTKFTDIHACIEFLANIKNEKTFLICSGELGETTVPLIHEMSQVNAIYIYC